jgi:hypothetical protein
VLDRLIQQAVLQVLQADWDGTFSETSAGERVMAGIETFLAKRAFKLSCPGRLTALLFGPDCAGGFCADATPVNMSPAQRMISERFIVMASERAHFSG